MSNLLAIDQASHISGWAVFENNKLIKFGKINATQTDVGERLKYIRQNIIKLIETYNIDEIAFEDIQLQNNITNNVQTFKILAEVFGVIYELCAELKIPATIVPSVVWKSTLSIKGSDRPTQKKNAQTFVKTYYKLDATQDECDAICIGTHTIIKSSSAF